MRANERVQPNDPLGITEADLPAACPLPPTEVILLWNSVAEDSGTLEFTLLRFVALLFEAAAHNAPPRDSSDSGGAGGAR